MENYLLNNNFKNTKRKFITVKQNESKRKEMMNLEDDKPDL